MRQRPAQPLLMPVPMRRARPRAFTPANPASPVPPPPPHPHPHPQDPHSITITPECTTTIASVYLGYVGYVGFPVTVRFWPPDGPPVDATSSSCAPLPIAKPISLGINLARPITVSAGTSVRIEVLPGPAPAPTAEPAAPQESGVKPGQLWTNRR